MTIKFLLTSVNINHGTRLQVKANTKPFYHAYCDGRTSLIISIR